MRVRGYVHRRQACHDITVVDLPYPHILPAILKAIEDYLTTNLHIQNVLVVQFFLDEEK